MTVLLLAGSGEARKLAQLLHDNGIDAMASLAGATRAPKPLPIPTRIGGFGGADGFVTFLRAQDITAVIDATHPFAHRISARSADVCQTLSVPYLQVLRPGWQAQKGDNWTEVPHEQDVAALIPIGDTVFLGTGRQTLDRFSNLVGRRVICRQIDPPQTPFPFEGGEYLVGRPPFSVQDEVALFQKLDVRWLVVKNSGGVPSATKLTAARQLNIPVIMIKRPNRPDGPCVSDVQDAITWLNQL